MTSILDNALKRIKIIMKDKGINQSALGEKCGFSQAKISNILLNKGKIEFRDIELICEILDVKLEDILKEEENALDSQETIYTQVNRSLEVPDSNFILNPDNMAFQGYLGEYYIYLYPTRSSESNLLKGKLIIKASTEENICRANLKILTGKLSRGGKEIEKEFNGQVIISLPMSSVYCILMNAQLAEINFLTFRHSFILNEELVCRLATLSTISSGDTRRPSTLRVLITREEMRTEEDIAFVKSQLLQNQSDITISEQAYDNLVKEGSFSEEFQNAFDLLKKEKKMYVIEESRLRSMINDKEEWFYSLSRLRNASESMRYNKIGTKADEQVYQYIQPKIYSETRDE